MTYYQPSNKTNYLAYFGIGGALWTMNYSRGKMCEKFFLFPFNHMVKIDNEWISKTTYSERCNAQDFFLKKTFEELLGEWEQVKNGKDDFQFSAKEHYRFGVLRRI